MTSIQAQFLSKIAARLRFFAIAILVLIAIVACQGSRPELVSISPSSTINCRLIQQEVGETKICGQPKRIVALGPYSLEPLLALGIQSIGFADHVAFHRGDYTDPRQQIPYLGDRFTRPPVNLGLAFNPSLESILKLKPDLIIGLEQGNTNWYTTLSKIAPTVLIDYADPEASLRMVAKAVNQSQKAEEVLTEVRQQIAAARKAFATFATQYSDVLLLSASELQIMSVESSTDACGALITALGFQLSGNATNVLSLEALADFNDADLIILLGSNFSNLDQGDFEAHQLSKLKQAWNTNAIAQSLSATKAGRVYFLPLYLCRGLPGAIGTKLYLNELRQQLLS